MKSWTLNRYLMLELLRPTLGATMLMLLLVWLTQSLRFLDLMINKGLSVFTFLNLTLLLIPFLLTFIFPLAIFAGVSTLFKRLNDDSELPPLFSAGLSGFRILTPTLTLTAFAIGFGYFLSFILLPIGMTAFKDLQHDLRHTEGHLFLEAGTFNQLGKDLMVYLKERTGPYSMQGILVYDNRDEEHPVTWMARSGKIEATENGYPRLTLKEGIRQDVTPNQVSMLQFEEHAVEIAQTLKMPEARSRSIEEYSMGELRVMAKQPVGMNVSDKDANKYRAEWHKRLLWPLSPLPLVLIAAAALLQPRVRRNGVGRNLVIAIVAAIAYQALLVSLHSLASQGNLTFLYGQWVLPIIFSCAALFTLWRGGRI